MTRSALIVLGAAIAAYVALRLWNLTRYSLWGGETFGLVAARFGWLEMMRYVIADVAHPPLFYVLLKVWIAIGGQGLLWLKLLPVLFAIATLVPLLLLCRDLRLPSAVVNLTVVLAAFNGYLIHYAQEVRGYSPLVFLGMTSLWLLLRWLKRNGHGLRSGSALFFVNLLLIFTHYYGWLVVAAQGAFVVASDRQRIGSFVVMVMGLGLAFAPWAVLVAEAAAAQPPVADWLPRPGLKGLSYLYANLNGKQPWPGSFVLGSLLFGAPVAIWAWTLVRRALPQSASEASTFWYLALAAFLPVVVLFLASELLPRSFFIDRYLIFTAIPYLTLVAAGVFSLQPGAARVACAGVLLLWSVTAGVRDVISNRVAWESPQVGSRVDWEALTSRLVAAESSLDTGIPLYTLSVRSRGLMTGDWALSTSIDFFLAELDDNRFRTMYARNITDLIARSAGEDHFWVAYIELDRRRGASAVEVLTDHGLVVDTPIVMTEAGHRVVLVPAWRDDAAIADSR